MKSYILKNIIVLILALFVNSASFVYSAETKAKNVLILNSYHRGFMWTDSVTIGTIRGLKAAGDINYFVQYLNSKHFGQSNFETEKNYLKEKYLYVNFDGLIVADDDALVFALKYYDELFSGLPIVFSGISNPERYNIEDRNIYGVIEKSSSGNVIEMIRQIMPQVRKILVLVDNSTTGMITRKNISQISTKYNNLKIEYPETHFADSILKQVSSNNDYDAIYYLALNAERDGLLVDYSEFGMEIIEKAKVPVFTSSPIFIGKGALGGAYQSGKTHGRQAAEIMANLLDSTKPGPEKKYYSTSVDYFFDNKLLKEYNINKSELPKESLIYNIANEINKHILFSAIAIVLFLLLIVFYLVNSNKKFKRAKDQIDSQFVKIQSQNEELSSANNNLNLLMTEIEQANLQLKESNVSLIEAKKKAEESDNLKSAFLANVSHEIRTPLNSIVGFSSLLTDEDLDSETKLLYANLIESNSESLLVLINDILDLSKIEANQIVLYKRRFCVDEILSELMLSFSKINNNTDVVLKLSVPESLNKLFIYADEVRFKQVFTNLLSNAFKYTDSGIIDFGYQQSKTNEIVFFVNDTGIGISKEKHEIIFERFTKLNEKGSKIYRGTGLGLAITKKLVDMSGGTIWLESEKNKGSKFSFTFQGIENPLEKA